MLATTSEIITIELPFFHVAKYLSMKFPGSNCKCKDFINRNNVGNCKGKKPSQFRRKFVACYVTQPSGCTDLKDSATNPGEKLSAEACFKKGFIKLHIYFENKYYFNIIR